MFKVGDKVQYSSASRKLEGKPIKVVGLVIEADQNDFHPMYYSYKIVLEDNSIINALGFQLSAAIAL